MQFNAIGVVHTPFTDLRKTPKQPDETTTEIGVIEVYHRYAEGLKDVDGFSHVILLTYLHRTNEEKLRVVPPMDDVERGVFATRSPLRPNHIGLTICELLKVEGRNLIVRGIDVLNGTPLLDIKPYLVQDSKTLVSNGWIEELSCH